MIDDIFFNAAFRLNSKRFELTVKEYYMSFSQDFNAFLRHQMAIVSPKVLKHHSITCNKIVQEKGEIII
jgi:jumonji domain-containing protein 2